MEGMDSGVSYEVKEAGVEENSMIEGGKCQKGD